jgi:glycine/D-amino acid oxidase-like deaminating enzyme
LAQSSGVNIVEQCAVRALDISGGQLQGVITEHGRVKCSQVVLAAGAWSALFLRRHDIELPADETFALRRRQDGGYTLAVSDRNEHFIGRDSFRHFRTYLPMIRKNFRSTPLRVGMPAGYPDSWRTARQWAPDEQTPFERCRVLHPEPSDRSVQLMRERFAQRFPQLGKPDILNAWAGMIDTMSSVLIATGMSGHGMGIGPGFGQVIARMLQGKQPGYDMTRFRLDRFSDGSTSVPGPHI